MIAEVAKRIHPPTHSSLWPASIIHIIHFTYISFPSSDVHESLLSWVDPSLVEA